jgi:GTP-binding protein Era
LLPLMASSHNFLPVAPVVPLPARFGGGVRPLVADSVHRLPGSPPYFPEEQLTDQTERFLVAEIIRERLFHHTGEEVPYAVAVAVEEFDEKRRPELVSIRAVIYVEKTSQKGIVIGKGGRLLKQVGQEAREEAERLLQAKVFLDLWVKVWKNWRRDPRALREFGYQA